MAKTESTAVNELIEIVQTSKPVPPDPSEDVMFKAPEKASARMTSTVPPIRGAGEVPPLPRTRAPVGTQRLTINQPPPVPVRVSTAPPSRNVTIPPIPAAAKRPSTPPPAEAPAPAPLASPAPAMLAPETLAPESFDISVELEAADSLLKTTPDLGPKLKTTLLGQGALASGSLPPIPAPKNRPTVPSMPAIPVPAARTSTPAILTSAVPPPPVAAAPAVAVEGPAAPLVPYVAHLPADMTSHQGWFDEHLSGPVATVEREIGTARVGRGAGIVAILPKLVMPMVIMVILGVFVGGYLAFDGDGGKKRTAAASTKPAAPEAAALAAPEPKPAVAAEPAQVEPAKVEPAAAADTEPAKVEPAPVEPAKVEPAPVEPAPVAKVEPAKVEPAKVEPAKVEPAPITPPNLVGTTAPARAVQPALVDVRIDSKPAGATVMLVDRGKSTFLGTTPLATALDPARKVELVFTYPNKPTHVEQLDPSAQKRIEVKLGRTSRTAKPATAQPAIEKKPVEKKPVEKKPVEKKPEAVLAEPFADAKPPAAPAGDGILMITSKPPAEIHIDGKPTGLMTPQRSIKLPAGKHRITLVTPEGKKKTIAVEITADQATKVLQDLL